jgi:hypothetical protein
MTKSFPGRLFGLYPFDMTEPWPAESLTESAIVRAAHAKAHEIEAHQRAIKIHKDAVTLFDWLDETKSAGLASVRSVRVRCCGWL